MMTYNVMMFLKILQKHLILMMCSLAEDDKLAELANLSNAHGPVITSAHAVQSNFVQLYRALL